MLIHFPQLCDNCQRLDPPQIGRSGNHLLELKGHPGGEPVDYCWLWTCAGAFKKCSA